MTGRTRLRSCVLIALSLAALLTLGCNKPAPTDAAPVAPSGSVTPAPNAVPLASAPASDPSLPDASGVASAPASSVRAP